MRTLVQATRQRSPDAASVAAASAQRSSARAGNAGTSTNLLAGARASSLLAPRQSTTPNTSQSTTQAAGDSANGKRLYRSRDGRSIELPPDMTAEDAARLEAEALAAEKHLGKGQSPQPVPEVRKPADKRAGKPAAAKEQRAAAKPGAPGKGAAPRTAGLSVRLKQAGGSAARYLLGRAAPVLAQGTARLRRLSQNEQSHASAAQKLGQAEKAVVVPASEGQSHSNSSQVSTVGARPAPATDANKGRRALQESLAANVPQSVEDADNFQRDKKAQHMGAQVLQVMQADKNAVVSTFADMAQTPPPAPPTQTPEPLPPLEAAPPTPALNLGQGAVAPLQPAHTDTSQYTRQADAKLSEEGVTQEQLDMVDSGDLARANSEKKGLERSAKTEPQALQQFARQEATTVDKCLQQEESRQRAALTTRRKQGLGLTAQKQKGAKSAFEKKREEVAARINSIYQGARDKVNKRLAALETQAMQRFDAGNARASQLLEDSVKRELEAFKAERYSGFFGWARKAKDWLLGMAELPQVKAIFDRNRARFVATVNQLVADIGAENQRVVQECKDTLARARTDIDDYVAKLGPSLRAIGKQVAGDVSAKLDELDSQVRKKEEELAQKLAERQQAAIKAIDDKIEKMKEAMSGALAKLGKLLLAAAKKFFTWALGKFGYSLGEIEGIINRGAAALKAIFTKPIVFVKNLMQAAIQGFKNFGKNFLTHLKNALFEWLTGSLEGLVLPKTWNLQGIIGVALQMIGISYQNIRRHLVTALGEPVVAGLEKTFALLKTLITEGPMAAWEQLKEMAADMRDAFVEAVKDFIKWKVIEEAIKWVVALFIPGAGIIKAIIGIYDTVVFFIQKAKQIARMVSSFLGSIAEIAAGNIGAAATAMENGLARGLSLVISFLAQLLHLNGITAKIRTAIQKIRAKVDAVLAKVANWIADKAKKLFGTLKTGVKSLIGWLKRERKFTVDGERHRLFFAGDARSAKLRVASDEKSLDDFLATVPKTPQTSASIQTVKDAQTRINQLRDSRKPPTPDAADLVVDPKIEAEFARIGDALPKLFGGDTWGTEAKPLLLVYPKKSASLYRPLYLGPRVNGRMTQSLLKSRLTATSGTPAAGFDKSAAISPTGAALDSWIARGGAVQEFKPFEQGRRWPDGGSHGGSATLGVAPKYLAQVGVSFNYEKGKTPGGKKINEALKKFGYYGRKNGGENSDGDHILEAQLIGTANADQIPNMWPLDKTENRHGENLEGKADVEVPGQPSLKFKGLLAAVNSKDKGKTKRSAGLRVMITTTVESK